MSEPAEGLAPLILRLVADITLQVKQDGLSILLAEELAYAFQ
jgi:ABC-type branched-subunit amino acid transport system ATPase component